MHMHEEDTVLYDLVYTVPLHVQREAAEIAEPLNPHRKHAYASRIYCGYEC